MYTCGSDWVLPFSKKIHWALFRVDFTLTSYVRHCSTLFMHASTLFNDNMAQNFDENMAPIFDNNMAQNLHSFSGRFVIGKIFIFRSLMSSKKSNFDPCHRQKPHTWMHNFVAFFKFRYMLSSENSNFDPCYRRKSQISIHVIGEIVERRSMLSAMPTLTIHVSTLFDVVHLWNTVESSESFRRNNVEHG